MQSKKSLLVQKNCVDGGASITRSTKEAIPGVSEWANNVPLIIHNVQGVLPVMEMNGVRNCRIGQRVGLKVPCNDDRDGAELGHENKKVTEKGVVLGMGLVVL